jgi:hypothetical protein
MHLFDAEAGAHPPFRKKMWSSIQIFQGILSFLDMLLSRLLVMHTKNSTFARLK